MANVILVATSLLLVGTIPTMATTVLSTSTTLCSGSYSPWNVAVDGVFPLRTVPGYFIQGDVDEENPEHYPPRLGLVPRRTWSDVDSELEASDAKLIVFLRHGEALHNADKARVGDDAWRDDYQYREDYVDAALTPKGIQQAVSAGEMLQTELREGGLSFDLVVVSPLDRTLNTYKFACKDLGLQAPVVAVELTRETLGVCHCDQRTSTAPKRVAFQDVDFSCIKNEDDVWWTKDHRETDAEIEDRARRFLHAMMTQSTAKRILVVSHSGFSRACLRALGHRYYRPFNGELVPVIITAKRQPTDEL